MFSKKTTSIIVTILSLFIISAMVYGAAKTQKVLEYSEELPAGIEDPYEAKAILGTVLNYPEFRDILGAEIGLNEIQKAKLAEMVKKENALVREYQALRLSLQEFNKGVAEIDKEIRVFLNPLQHAKFRDWVIEEWQLELNQSRLIHNELILMVVPITVHWLDFMQSQLKLTQKEAKIVKQLIHQAKQETLPSRRELLEIIRNPNSSWEKMTREGARLVQQLQPKSEKLESDILKTLPVSKRKLYKSLVEASVGK